MGILEYVNSNNVHEGGIFWDRRLEQRFRDDVYLEQYGYKVYSQNDEDGILHEVFNRIGCESKLFVEIGVQNGLECNTYALLLQGWKGLWVEGDKEQYKCATSIFMPAISGGRLRVVNSFVDVDNINSILMTHMPDNEIDLLSIDIDGNDYYIWDAIACIKPRVVCIEYNGKFPPEIDWVMNYDANHKWDGSDYYGASLKALEILGENKGYQLVGTSIRGANAFFVDKKFTKNRFAIPPTSENLFNPFRSNLRFESNHPAIHYVGSR